MSSAGPADVVVQHMAVGGNPSRASSPNRWICSRQSASATRLGDQACISYSRWRPNQRVIAGGKRGHDRLIINSIRLALEAASLQWMEGDN